MTKSDMEVVGNGARKSGAGDIKPPPEASARATVAANSGAPSARPSRYFYDITADGTHQGKSTIATRLRAHCEDAGLSVTMVRIESEHVAKGLGDDDVLVPVEEIGQAGRVVGGIVGVMEPALTAVTRMIERGGVVVMDWGGGLGEYRLELLAATGLDHVLAQENIPAWTIVVATDIETSMAQALRVLERTALMAPELQRAVVLNRLHGAFDAASSTPQGRRKDALLSHKGLGATLNFPLVSGQSMAALAPLGLDHRAMLELIPEEVARRLGISPFLARALLAHFAAWYAKSTEEMEKIAPFSE
ncbi:hypothetical protein IED13_17500 [Bosea sp. SSUT16]|uniref:Uncharacterized protein n=1 Tax=Bosea spartocytisi TaxID=2773451 RepID=A0A927I0N5_9HYPH|nr:hypothetical protein [Bosea spartocytisi]MBD3847499.1 hypothetical protein [Bosea spartocytisi]MCT4474563.1 hypothetical protein [Bosea spartocytisi]